MIDRIIINVGLLETRIALMSGCKLIELIIHDADSHGLENAVCLGRIGKRISGFDAAFVDIGCGQSGFLAANELPEFRQPDAEQAGSTIERQGIKQLLQEGERRLVQVTKEAIGNKGPRLSGIIRLPGRYLVYMPEREDTALSRRLQDEVERERLRAIVAEQLQPFGGGAIIRTAAQGQSTEAIAADLQILHSRWQHIQQRAGEAKSPRVIFHDTDPVIRSLRDHSHEDLKEIRVDNGEQYAEIADYLRSTQPALLPRLHHHQTRAPIFDAMDIETQIEAALEKHVPLSSGGWISIESTEALTAIDINAGKFTAGLDLEETALTVNLEAAGVIAQQLRLRGIGGLIVVDFIHMNATGNVDQLLNTFQAALAQDKAPIRMSSMSEFGLVELTRKRVREPLAMQMTADCTHCRGVGRTTTSAQLLRQLLHTAEREAGARPGIGLHIRADKTLLALLQTGREPLQQRLSKRLGCRIECASLPEPAGAAPSYGYDIGPLKP